MGPTKTLVKNQKASKSNPKLYSKSTISDMQARVIEKGGEKGRESKYEEEMHSPFWDI